VIFKFLFLGLLSFNLFAFSSVEVELHSGQKIHAQYIETYEDRWFYEPPINRRDHYVLLFELVDQRPVFHFFKLGEIKAARLSRSKTPDLNHYLKSRGWVLNEVVVEEAVVLTGHKGHHKLETMFGNFAWDLGIRDSKGSQFQNDGSKLEDYYIFAKEVRSPFDGIIVGLENNSPDNPPDPHFNADIAGLEANYVLILLEYPFYFSLVHFQKDSLTVAVRDSVKKGDLLGLVGNSGVSYIPHLHMTMFLYLEQFDRFISIPVFSDRYASRI